MGRWEGEERRGKSLAGETAKKTHTHPIKVQAEAWGKGRTGKMASGRFLIWGKKRSSK